MHTNRLFLSLSLKLLWNSRKKMKREEDEVIEEEETQAEALGTELGQ